MEHKQAIEKVQEIGEVLYVQLRQREFSKDTYQDLMMVLRDYREHIRGKPLVERGLVALLYFLDLEFRGALNFYSDMKNTFHAEFHQAQIAFSDLVVEIFTPDNANS